MPILAALTGARAFGFSRIMVLMPGGYITNSNTTMSKLTYATDTASAIPDLSPMTYRSTQGGLTNPGVAGYILGGFNDPAGGQVSIDKITYASDSTSVIGNTMTTAYRGGAYSAHNGNTAGYVFGGYSSGSNTTSAEKMTYSTQAMSNIGASLSVPMRTGGSATNAGVFAYFMGGIDSSYSNSYSTVDKFTFSGESRSTLGTGLATNLGDNTSGFSNSGTAGYNGNGVIYSGGNGNGTRNINKFNYANDARSIITNGVTGFAYVNGGMTNHQVAGYILPNDGSSVSADKFSFPSDTKSTVSSAMLVNKQYVTTLSNSL